MAHNISSKCRELDEHSIYEDIVCKIESMQSQLKSLEILINDLTVNCDKFKQDSENSMGVIECRLLRIRDDIGVKRQAYHVNFVVGNHYKVILAKVRNGIFNFSKICSVLCDQILKKKFFLICLSYIMLLEI